MQRQLLTTAVVVVLLAAAGVTGSVTTTVVAKASSTISGCAPAQLHLYRSGRLTVATDSPAYTPWFAHNQPKNGEGYESAVAYAIAAKLGFKKSQVHWTIESFDSSYAPGPKAFDFDNNEIRVTAARATAVTFSEGYYNDREALITVKGQAMVKDHSPSQLKQYKYGDQVGTTSLTYIEDKIEPTQTPSVYSNLNDVASALSNHTIQGFVTDAPTAQYMAASGEVKHGVVVGQFPSNDEVYGLLFAKGNPLVTCVDKAISSLKANGTLSRLQNRWLGIYDKIPTIQP
ncbi:MAG: transporter substrate-binding domain-containing protein [Candidatus Dormiibacterota bacterium]